MSSEHSASTLDLRSRAQDYKRDAARKHKWALGTITTAGRLAGGKPRPHRPSETWVSNSSKFTSQLTSSSNFNARRRDTKSAIAALENRAKVSRRVDMLEGIVVSDESSSSASDYDETPSPPVDVNVIYSFDAARSPAHGSQILNAALAKAVEKFEDRETVKLVKDEYEVLNDEGESVGLTPAKGGKKEKAQAIIVPDADEDYELV